MTIEQLIGGLMEVVANHEDDPEIAHGMMDDLLIEYVNDIRVKEIWESQTRWYA